MSEKLELTGELAYNLYFDTKCKSCNKNIGLVVISPHFKCQVLEKKILLSLNNIKCYESKNKGKVFLNLNQVFNIDDFEDVTGIQFNNK